MYQQPPSNQNVPTYTPPEQPYSQYPQPPPQDYPSYPPPPYQQPPQPKRKRRIWLWIVVIVALIVVYQVGHAAITDISATSQAIQPPAATDIPTLAPTATPLTNKDAITKEVQADITAASLTGDVIQAGYGKKDNAFALVGLKPPLTMSKDEQLTLVLTDCFDGQKAIWTDPLLAHIGSMEVFVFTQDSQGLPVTVGDCILHPYNASLIDWNSTDALTAWNNKAYEDMTP